MKIVPAPDVHTSLADYAEAAHLVPAVTALRAAAARAMPALHGRTVWMVNSTAAGGGVAELLPGQIAILRELGVDVRWAVLQARDPGFFTLTKRLHNMIHGARDAHPTASDRATYDAVNAENARALRADLRANDIVIVHDPQPAGLALHVAQGMAERPRFVWRSHIGLDESNEHTVAAWRFLEPYVAAYDRCVFSLDEYVPDFLRQRATVIHPTIDPLSHKNRDLSLHKMVGIACDAGLATPHWPLLDPPFDRRATRLQADGTFAPATAPDDIGLLGRPIVTQVSRWDRLKGFRPLMEGFTLLKGDTALGPLRDERHGRRLELTRLVLAGPDPAAIQDDPEGLEVFGELTRLYVTLPPRAQRDIAIVTLPMTSRKQNGLMVNVLQRASDIVVQNSLREGFGLTVAEAMWKRKAVLGSGRAAGIRLQLRDRVDGQLVADPEDPRAIAMALHDMLSDSDRLDRWGRNAQMRAHDELILLGELARWLELLASL